MAIVHERTVVLVLWSVLLLYIGLAIAGGVINYSPVPFWDMWDDMELLYQAPHPDPVLWWTQHNEHRIVLTRLLVWLDLTYFNGDMWPLIIANFLLAATSSLLFIVILKDRLSGSNEGWALKFLAPVLLTILWSWSQHENLTWAYQSQFFLAQLLPLASFYLLHRVVVATSHGRSLFVLACALGCASLGTMANGVFTLPLMVLLGLLLNIGWRRVAILILLAAGGTVLYFYNYHSAAAAGSLADVLVHSHARLIAFILVYLGGPFLHLTGGTNYVISAVAAVFSLGSAVFFTSRALTSPRASSLQLSLLIFFVYIVATAAITAVGRISYGVWMAGISRYQTPTLMMWAVVLVLYAPSLARLLRAHQGRVAIALLAIPLILLPQQLEALSPQRGMCRERLMAALALELGIRDHKQVGKVCPSVDHGMAFAALAADANLSVFSSDIIKDARQLIGTIAPEPVRAPRVGVLDEVAEIDGDDRYVRVTGRLVDADPQMTPKAVRIMNDAHRVLGYALTGAACRLGAEVDTAGAASRFRGYLLKGQSGQRLIFLGDGPDGEQHGR